MAKATRNGWKKCSRGHNYRGGHCPICWSQTKQPGSGRQPRAR